MRRTVTAALTCALWMAASGWSSAAQAPTEEHRQLLNQATRLKSDIISAINGRRLDEATRMLDELANLVDQLKKGGVPEKDGLLVGLENFVELQRKAVERARPAGKAKSKAKTKKTDPEPAKPASPESSGDGVSFVKDVAPIFARNCQGCHGTNNPRSKFSLATFSSLMKGGELGDDDIVPGKPEESRLVLMLKGEEEPRMPRNGRSLRDDLIEKVELWVKQGAKFDGAPKFTPNSTLADMVPSAEEELRMKVAAMSDAELLELHRTRAKEHWAVSNPAKSPEMTETENFIVIGSLPPSELEQAGQWAESALKDVRRIFGQSAKDTVWRGKLTLHLFADRHEYSELAMVVENREVPREILGHRFQLPETSYAAVPKPSEDSGASLKGLVVEQVVAAYLAAQGESPAWFQVGLGRYLAARSDPKANIYREYRNLVREAATSGDITAALFGDSSSEDPAVIGFGLIDFLATVRPGERGLAQLAAELHKKTPAEKGIQGIYGMDRRSLAAAWTQFAVKRYPVVRKR